MLDGDDAVTDDQPCARVQTPRTATVLGLLALTSLSFSYLAAYAVSAALVESEVLRPWQPGSDPRPKWLVASFLVLMTGFLCVAGVVRQLSRRQIRQIDEMETDETHD